MFRILYSLAIGGFSGETGMREAEKTCKIVDLLCSQV